MTMPTSDAADPTSVGSSSTASDTSKTTSDIAPPSLLERMAHAFLDPRSIQGMMIIGGCLFVLGMLVYLISWGIFENKIVLAITLGTCSLLIWGGGILTTLRSRYQTAGRALTFLGCVVLPLNLWFYHAQDLLRIDQGLWAPSVICSGLFLATAWLLKDSLFIFAVQAGVTLTALLVMADFAPAASPLHVGILLQALATLSIHLERSFVPGSGSFSRERFGLATFWTGHLQLLAGLAIIGGYQVLNASSFPDLRPRELFAWLILLKEPNVVPPALAMACLWLWGTYLYIYSRLVVSDRPLFSVLAGLTIVAAEVTIIGRRLSIDTHLTIATGIGTLLLIIGQGVRTSSFTKIGHLLSVAALMSTVFRGSIDASLQTATWLDVSRLGLVTAFSVIMVLISRKQEIARFYATLTCLLTGIILVDGYRLLQLSTAQMFEIIFVAIGALISIHGCIKRFEDSKETDIREWAGQMWVSSLFIVTPLMLACYGHRFGGSISLGDDMILATFSLLLLLTGIAWRIRATSIIGGLSLAIQLLVVTGSLIYRPDTEMGVHLAIGGGLVFLTGLVLSVYRDRVLSISGQFARHEGIFQVLDWR